MAAITLDIGGNTRQLDRDIQKTVNKVYNINLKSKGDQPLGRITGKVNEFNKSLDASNARVIAFGASAGIIFGVERAFTALVSSTIEVQKSLQDINVILNVSAQNLQKFGGELFSIARNTGQSFQEVAKAATEFSRQGLGVEETLKRTNEALILSRLSGLDAAKSVESLTAAVNSFASQAVTATEVVNKFATVDAAFAVSSADLADAIARVGSSAAQSGVSLNELIAIVTSAQQTTARGGAVIGNSFKTIFTRLQREKVVDLLESLGISGTDSAGQVKSTIQLLQDLGSVYDKLGSQQQAYVAEQVGGVFQINILKAALADLGKEYSIYSSALNVAAGATDQAIRRNEELNKTYSAQINALAENARQLAAAGGERLLGPSIDRLVGGTNTLLKGFSESDGQGVGEILGKGILDGLGQFIAGPGLALIGGVLLKLFRDLAKFATGSVKELLGLNTAATQQRDLQQSINQILSKNPQLLELALKGEQGLNAAANNLLASLQKQTVELQKQATVAAQISKALISQAGVRVSGGVPVAPIPKPGRTGKAAGYIPNFASDKLVEKYTAISLGATSSVRSHMSQGTIGGKKFVMNNQEVEFPGVGKNGDSMVLPTYGDGPRIAAAGFIPNFAATGKKRISKETRQRSELFRKYGYLVPPGVGNGFLSGLGDEFPDKAIRVREPKLQNVNSDRDELKLEKNISTKIADYAVAFTNTLKPLGRTVNKTEIEKSFQTTAGAKGAISGAVGAAFEVAISRALDYKAAQREGGDFDVRGGKNLQLVQDLFGISVPLADFKVSTSGDAKSSFYDKIRKEEGLKRGNVEQQKKRDQNDARKEALTQLRSSNPEWFTRKGDKLLDPKNFPGGPEAYKQANERLNIRTDRILSGYGGVGSTDALRSLAGRRRFAYGYIPNFAAIQDAVSRERAAGIPSNQIYLAQEKALTSANPMGIGVFNKLQEPTKQSRKDAMRRKGFASGYVPNFAIEDPDIQGASPETATAAIISAISGVAFAFAFTGNQFKDSLKELTIATKATASTQRNQLAKDIRERRNLGAPNAAIRQSLSAERAAAKQAGTPGIIAKGATFGRANALGLSIAAPILGEVIKNAVGQETAGARQFGAVASGAGQIGSFAATGALVAKGGGPIGLAIGALLTIPGIINDFTTKMPELSAAAKKASQDLTKFSDVSQRLLAASSSLSEFTDKGASPEKLKKVQDDLAKALSELTPSERSRIESSIKLGNLEEELAKITQERIDREKLTSQAVAVRAIAEKKGFLGLPSTFDPNTAQGKLDEQTIRDVFKGFFTGKTTEETLANFNKAAKSGVPQLQNLSQAVAQLERDIDTGTAGRRNLYGTFEGPDYRQEFTKILESFIPQGQTADEQEARARFIKDLVSIADNDIKTFQNILQIPIKSLTRDRQQLEEGIKSAKKAAESTAVFNKVKEKYTGIIDNSISSLNRTIATFNALANALDKFQVNEKSFEREQGVGGLGLRKNIAETVLGPEAELTRRAALFEKIAQNEANRLDAIDQSSLDFRQNFRENLKDVFTERAGEIATTKGQTATTIPEQAAVANEVLRAVKLFESGAVDINNILESSFKDGAIDPDQFKTSLGAAFQAAEFKTPATNKILDSILSAATEQLDTARLDINQKASQENQRAAQEFANEKILLDIRRSLQVFGGIEKFLAPPEEGIVKPLETLIQSATGQLQSQRGFEFAKRTGAGTSLGSPSQIQNNINLGQSALNFIKQLKDLSGGAFAPDPGSELFRRATAGLAQSFENNIKQLNDVLKDPKVDQAFKVQIQSALDAIGSLGSSREIAQLQIAKETGAAFQSTLEGTLSRLQDPAIQELRDAGLSDLADAVARSAQYTSDPIVNVLSVQKGIQTAISTQLKTITELIKKTPKINKPSIVVNPSTGETQTNAAVTTNAKGLIPAFNKERKAISRGVGGAKAGDRPKFIPNLNGGPAFVNTGEQLVNNFGGSGQTAVLTRDMQKAMVMAKGFIPNFAPQEIIDPNEFPKEEPLKKFSGNVLLDQQDTKKPYIVIKTGIPLDESWIGQEINFGAGKQNGKIISVDSNNFKARVGDLKGKKGDLPPTKGLKFTGILSPKKDIREQGILEKKFNYYKSIYDNASDLDQRESDTDALILFGQLKRSFESDIKKYKFEREPQSGVTVGAPDLLNQYFGLKEQTTKSYDKLFRQLNPGLVKDPIYKTIKDQVDKKYGPKTKNSTDQIQKAAAASETDIFTDATIRAAKVTSTIGKYTGLNLGGDNPFGKAGQNPVVKYVPKKGATAAGTTDNEVRYYKFPGIGTVINEATALNQNFPGVFRSQKEREEASLAIQEAGGTQNYLKKLKKLADFLEQQNKKATKDKQFTFIAGTVESLSGKYSDTRAFSSQGQIVSSEFQYAETDPLFLQERASTLNDFLSRGIVSGAITAQDMGALGVPIDVAKNIIAEIIAIDKQLKEKTIVPPPALPGIPPATATVPPPPTVTELPTKPTSKQPEPPAAVPGIQPAIQDTTPTITVRKPRKPPVATGAAPQGKKTNYPGGISPETARAIVQELDANYNEAIRNQKNPQTALAWAQTQQRYRLLYAQGKYAELDRFYQSLRKDYQRPIGQNPNKNQNQTNFATGFIPNFAENLPIDDYLEKLGRTGGISGASLSMMETNNPSGLIDILIGFLNNLSRTDTLANGFMPGIDENYIANLAGLESEMSNGAEANLGYDKKIGLFMSNKDQPKNLSSIIAKDHPEGLKAAMKNSMQMQKKTGVLSKGYIPNFAVTDQSFVQQEVAFNNNTLALTKLSENLRNLNSTFANFEENFANLNNTAATQQLASTQQNNAQPNVRTTTNAPINVVVNAQNSNDLSNAVGEAVKNAIPGIIDKVRLALGEKIPPSTQKPK